MIESMSLSQPQTQGPEAKSQKTISLKEIISTFFLVVALLCSAGDSQSANGIGSQALPTTTPSPTAATTSAVATQPTATTPSPTATTTPSPTAATTSAIPTQTLQLQPSPTAATTTAVATQTLQLQQSPKAATTSAVATQPTATTPSPTATTTPSPTAATTTANPTLQLKQPTKTANAIQGRIEEILNQPITFSDIIYIQLREILKYYDNKKSLGALQPVDIAAFINDLKQTPEVNVRKVFERFLSSFKSLLEIIEDDANQLKPQLNPIAMSIFNISAYSDLDNYQKEIIKKLIQKLANFDFNRMSEGESLSLYVGGQVYEINAGQISIADNLPRKLQVLYSSFIDGQRNGILILTINQIKSLPICSVTVDIDGKEYEISFLLDGTTVKFIGISQPLATQKPAPTPQPENNASQEGSSAPTNAPPEPTDAPPEPTDAPPQIPSGVPTDAPGLEQ
jgi:hypothetical protein